VGLRVAGLPFAGDIPTRFRIQSSNYMVFGHRRASIRRDRFERTSQLHFIPALKGRTNKKYQLSRILSAVVIGFIVKTLLVSQCFRRRFGDSFVARGFVRCSISMTMAAAAAETVFFVAHFQFLHHPLYVNGVRTVASTFVAALRISFIEASL
jgi:hypothetical protein